MQWPFMPINQNQAMFALPGTTYGGNGQATFALPNLRGRLPLHMGNGHTLGEAAGPGAPSPGPRDAAALPCVAGPGGSLDREPVGHAFAHACRQSPEQCAGRRARGGTAALNLYGPAENLVAMSASTAANTGGSQPHNNMMPHLVLNFIIALQGIFPSQN